MRHFILLFFTIYNFAFIQGQTIIDVNTDKTDFLWIETNGNFSIVKINNDSVIVMEINCDDNDRTILLDTTIYKTSLSEFKENYVDEKEIFLPVRKLYKNKTDKFILQLSEYQFNDGLEDGFVTKKINITKDKYLLVRSYDCCRTNASLYKFDTIPLIILRINKKHHITTIDNNFFLQTSKNNFIQLSEKYKLQIVKKEPNDSIIKDLVNLHPNNYKDISAHQIIKEKGKYGMRNLLGEQIFPCIYDTIIHPEKYDTMSMPYRNELLFLALKNGKGILCNGYFKEIAKNIRCVIPTENSYFPYIVLQNNKLRYLTEYFEICDSLKRHIYGVCGTVTSYGFKTEKTEDGFKIHKEIGGITQIFPQVFPYFLKEKYDSLLFLNGKNKFSFDANCNIKFQKSNFLIFEKNKQFGIIEIEMPLLDCRQDSLKKYSSWISVDDYYNYRNKNKNKKIVFEHQNITPKIIVSDLDSVIFFSEYDYPAKIYKNGLCTYFPISKELKYAEIHDFNRYFARFRLPNGKEGWLSRNGVEYLDK